jgi:type III pantothenate kinase
MMGAACMLDGMVQRMEEELGEKTTVVVTGGIARFVIPMCRTPMIYDKDLLLKGLVTLYRENTN